MKYRLGDLVQIKYGKDHKKLNAGNIPVYGTGGLMRRVNDFIYDGDSVLIPRKGSLNNVMYVTSKFWTVDTMFWTKIDKNKILPKYLYYCLSKIDLSTFNVGSAVPSLTIKILNEITLEVPSLQIQNEIISKIKPIEDKIRLNNKINDNLTKLINLLFLEVYKSALLYKPLKEVANVSNGYAFKSKDLLDVPIDNSSPVFKMGNIKNNGGFDHTKIKSWVTPDYYPKDKFLAQYGDILMSMTDMKDNVRILGHTALMDVDKKYYINQRVCLIRPTKLPFEYLYPLTNSDDYINELRKHANHGVQVNLTIKSIKDSKIRIPNNNQLQKYIKLVRPLFEQLINNNQENLIMSQIKCNLLNKFF